MENIVFTKPNEVRVIDGVKIGAFDPSFLRPGDRYYDEIRRNQFRSLFKKLRPSVIANILPPSILVPDEDTELWVCDGNHRVEAADFTVKPAIGIVIDSQDDLDTVIQIANENRRIWDATEFFRENEIVVMDQLKSHIAEVRIVLKDLGIQTFDDYREKAQEISNSPGYRKDIRYR